jgi:hypothetical protein
MVVDLGGCADHAPIQEQVERRILKFAVRELA